MNLCTSKLQGGMGFRDFESFNDALLGKQSWRILKNPNSLVSQILKSKYFYYENFSEAELGRFPSFLRRSIWNAKSLLLAGLRWKIGDGHSVKARTRNWIPRPATFKFPSFNCRLCVKFW